jgi:hypothetical protein
MTDPKEVEPIKEQEAEKVEDEKKSETEDKEKTEDKVREAEETEKAGDDKMETDDVEKGDDDKKEEEPKKEEDAAAAKAKTTKKRKKDEVAKTAPEEGDNKEDIETAAGTDGRTKREKRVRKSADVFEPDNFLGKDKSLQVVAGRGTKLAEIDAVKATIDKLSMNSADLMLAHRLLYTRQGKPAKKEIKKNLLEFCGFLPLAEEGQDKKVLEALEEEAEVRIEYSGFGFMVDSGSCLPVGKIVLTLSSFHSFSIDLQTKMSTKAFKLTIPLIKKLCDLFHVDRFKLETKDALIDALLDFLGAPSEDQLKGGKKSKKAAAASASAASAKSSSGKKKKKAAASTERDDVEEDDEEADDEDDDDDAPLKKGDLPSDEALRKWVRAYVRCFNLEKATVKHAIATASDKFGVDVSKKKSLLKELLTSEM